MERARVTRFIRIAVTALSLTACVLLIALWVRSHFVNDAIQGPLRTTQRVDIGSWQGRIRVSVMSFTPDQKWSWNATPAAEWVRNLQSAAGWGRLIPPPKFVSFSIRTRPKGWVAWSPHWFLCSVSAIFAVVPWIHKLRWRFSLRTLLIATTLVAVGLGTVVYLTG